MSHIKPEEWLQGQVELKIMKGLSYNKDSPLCIASLLSLKLKFHGYLR